MENLIKIQNEIKVPKGNFNSFGNYKYRSAEDILEVAKPILLKYNASLYLFDSLECHSGRIFNKATARLVIDGKEIESYGYAELSMHKGMTAEQCNGVASSYSRKYALNGLFCIDETESDADHQKPQHQTQKPEAAPKKDPLEHLKSKLALCKTVDEVKELDQRWANNKQEFEAMGIFLKGTEAIDKRKGELA